MTVLICKHCGEEISGQGPTYKHVTGLQRGMGRCAVTPYGYNAELPGTPCGMPCRGEFVEDEVVEVHR